MAPDSLLRRDSEDRINYPGERNRSARAEFNCEALRRAHFPWENSELAYPVRRLKSFQVTSSSDPPINNTLLSGEVRKTGERS